MANAVPPANKLRRRFEEHAATEVRTSIVSFEEQMRGWTAYLADAKKMARTDRRPTSGYIVS